MKTAKEWLKSFNIEGHKPDCICARCKEGTETFLLESDIAEIQRDALMDALEIIRRSIDSYQDDMARAILTITLREAQLVMPLKGLNPHEEEKIP